MTETLEVVTIVHFTPESSEEQRGAATSWIKNIAVHAGDIPPCIVGIEIVRR